MRFSLQDIRKSIQRRNGALSVSLHFLRPGTLQREIEQLIVYHEGQLGQPQRLFVLEDARACIGEYRLAHCLIATLSHWYTWQQCEWTTAIQEAGGNAELAAVSSAVQLRLALYSYVNEQQQGFLDAQTRECALQAFAQQYGLSTASLEALLVLDSEEEALLTRETAQPPDAQEVATLYNQWAFEAALCNASSVSFVIDCHAFAYTGLGEMQPAGVSVEAGIGAVIKRLCYLARRLGVYYDLEYESEGREQTVGRSASTLLTLTLYGPQEVTGAPQQYGLRLARLCRLLLGYGVAKTEQRQTTKKATLSKAIIAAEAHIHFLQRAYIFTIDASLLQLLPPIADSSQGNTRSSVDATQLYDSSIEQSFSEAFIGSANSQGVDGWRLEREPEPLLLEQGIFIPDFAFTRDERRIYVEILGFWTPAYRERKIQKLQQLREREDLLLAIPVEAKAAFTSIANDFPIVYYAGQLSVTDVLRVLRNRYDDFAQRLASIDSSAVREQVQRAGLLPERACYNVLHCYRHTELQRAAEQLCASDETMAFVPGIGLYHQAWMLQVKQAFMRWISSAQTVPLAEAVQQVKQQVGLVDCADTTVETLLGLWPEIHIQRTSIFEAVVELVDSEIVAQDAEPQEAVAQGVATEMAAKDAKQSGRGRRTPIKRQTAREPEVIQGDLWGERTQE